MSIWYGLVWSDMEGEEQFPAKLENHSIIAHLESTLGKPSVKIR